MRRLLVPLLAGLALLVAAGPAAANPTRAAVFSGTGVWVDVWDFGKRTPAQVVAVAEEQGTPVIYIETANWRSKTDVVNPAYVREVVRLGRAAGLRVVPWYRPGYRNLQRDRRRLAAAAGIGGAGGIDGLGIDVEATLVMYGALRARRAAELAAWARATYPQLPIAAIIPSPVSMYWPVFPYAELHAASDAFLPMCYPSRRHSAERVYADAKGCVDVLRQRTGDPNAEVHVITGSAGLSAAQLDAAARGARDAGATGFSLYDLATTRPDGWTALGVFAAG
ncbi:MAG: hypothetical protein ACKOSO_05900 [Actinomycetota bacterium]